MPYQYRIMVNGIYSPIYNELPLEAWDKVIAHRDRVIKACLERRLVTDSSILPMLCDTTDIAIKFKDTVISHWEVQAELH